MAPRYALALFSLIILQPVGTFSQFSLSQISAQAGVISVRWQYGSESGNPFYAEVQIGGRFVSRPVTWALYWGHWDDGIDHPLPIIDAVTYSYSSHIIGARIGISVQEALKYFPLPLELYAGASHHFAHQTYIGGSDYFGNRGVDASVNTTTAELGVNALIPIVEPVRLLAGLQQYFPFTQEPADELQRERRMFRAGISVLL